MSTAYFLEEEAAARRRTAQGYELQIEATEKQLVQLREWRDKSYQQAAEMTAGANILKQAGLRSEIHGRSVTVSIDNPPFAADHSLETPQ